MGIPIPLNFRKETLKLRIRNNKVNVFLSDDEKFIFKKRFSKLNLSHLDILEI